MDATFTCTAGTLCGEECQEIAPLHLGPSLEDLEQRTGVEDHVKAIKNNLWSFVLDYFEGDRERESVIFWHSLLAHDPRLAQEALETINARRATDPAHKRAKSETLEASRRFFTRDLEQLIVRQLAVGMQCIPSDVDVFRLTEEQRLALRFGCEDYEFLKDAFLGRRR